MASMTQPENETQALTVIEGSSMVVARPPDEVLIEAQRAAEALQGVISQKPRPVMMNGEQYLEFEDWSLLGRFYGITAKQEGDVEFVDFAGVQGFKATCLAVDRDGRELSRATAFCLSDEEKWGERTKYAWVYVLADGGTSVEDPGPGQIVWVPNPNKPGKTMPKKERQPVGLEKVPLFQLASMAQTRANAKVLRNVLSWVAVLAGYRPTPAEEIEDLPTAQRVSTPAAQVRPTREPGEDNDGFPDRSEEVYAEHQVEPARHPEPQRNGAALPPCPECKNARTVIHSKFKAGVFVCYKAKGGCGHQWPEPRA